MRDMYLGGLVDVMLIRFKVEIRSCYILERPREIVVGQRLSMALNFN